jgi:hypothetical protein
LAASRARVHSPTDFAQTREEELKSVRGYRASSKAVAARAVVSARGTRFR